MKSDRANKPRGRARAARSKDRRKPVLIDGKEYLLSDKEEFEVLLTEYVEDDVPREEIIRRVLANRRQDGGDPQVGSRP